MIILHTFVSLFFTRELFDTQTYNNKYKNTVQTYSILVLSNINQVFTHQYRQRGIIRRAMPLTNRFRVFMIGISTPSISNQYFVLI